MVEEAVLRQVRQRQVELQKAKESMPKPSSQQALRSKQYGGVRGRQALRGVKKQREKIEQRKEGLKGYEELLKSGKLEQAKTLGKYRDLYSGLKGNVQSLLQNPEQIRKTRTKQIEERIEPEVEKTNEKIAELEQAKKERIDAIYDWYYNSEDADFDEKNMAVLKAREQYVSEINGLREYKQSLKKAISNMKENKELYSYDSIKNYAERARKIQERNIEGRYKEDQYSLAQKQNKEKFEKVNKLIDEGGTLGEYQKAYKELPGILKTGFTSPKEIREGMKQRQPKIQSTITYQDAKTVPGFSYNVKGELVTDDERKRRKNISGITLPDKGFKAPTGSGLTRTRTDWGGGNLDTLKEEARNVPESKNILLADTEKLGRQQENIEMSSRRMKKISQNMDKTIKDINQTKANVTLTDEGKYEINLPQEEKQSKELKERLKDLKEQQQKYNIEEQRIEAYGGKITKDGRIEYPKITEGFFGLKGKTSIQDYRAEIKSDSGIVKAGGFVTGFFGNIGRTAGELAEKGVELTDSEKIRTTPLGTSTVNPLTGEPQLEKTREKFSEEQIQKIGEGYADVGRATGRMGQYAVPYWGEALYGVTVSEEIKREGGIKEWAKENKAEAALVAGTAVLGVGMFARGISKTTRLAKRQKLLREATEDISGRKLESIRFVDEGSGMFSLRGVQRGEKGTREIKILGQIKKTEKGKKFVPVAKGESRLISDVGGYKVKLAQKFKAGSLPTKSKDIGSIGDVMVKKTFGEGTFIPKEGTYSIIKSKRYPTGKEGLTYNPFKGEFQQVGYFKKSEQTRKTLDVMKREQKQARRNVFTGGDTVKEGRYGYEYIFPEKEGKRMSLDVSPGVRKVKGQEGSQIGLTFFKKAEKGDKGYSIVKGTGKKTPLSKTFARETKVDTKVVQETPKLDTKTITTGLDKQAEKIVSKTKFEPKATGKEGFTSIYAGKGMYEKTDEGMAIAPSLSFGETTTAPKIEILGGSGMKTGGVSKSLFDEKSKFDSGLKIEQTPKTPQTSKVKELSLLRDAIIGKPKLKERQRLIGKQKIIPATKTTTKTTPKTKLIQTPKVGLRPPKPPIVPPVIPQGGKGTQKDREEAEDERMFEAFAYKRGKPFKIGEFGRREEAEKELSGKLTGTLRASGYVTKGGKKIEVDLGAGFRPSKQDPFRVVQKKTKRFGTFGETREAQMFRKKRSKKKSLI